MEKFSRHAVHRSWPDVHIDAHRLPSPEPQKAEKIEILSQELAQCSTFPSTPSDQEQPLQYITRYISHHLHTDAYPPSSTHPLTKTT